MHVLNFFENIPMHERNYEKSRKFRPRTGENICNIELARSNIPYS